MKLRLVYIQSNKEPWAQSAAELYQKKLKAFGSFEILAIKAKNLGRSESEAKKRLESEALISKLDGADINILFDEKGKSFDSLKFSSQLQSFLETSRRVSFFIGGAYGIEGSMKSQFEHHWSLSELTYNHLVAKTVILEQIYRAMTIVKKIPYHNQ